MGESRVTFWKVSAEQNPQGLTDTLLEITKIHERSTRCTCTYGFQKHVSEKEVTENGLKEKWGKKRGI